MYTGRSSTRNGKYLCSFTLESSDRRHPETKHKHVRLLCQWHWIKPLHNPWTLKVVLGATKEIWSKLGKRLYQLQVGCWFEFYCSSPNWFMPYMSKLIVMEYSMEMQAKTYHLVAKSCTNFLHLFQTHAGESQSPLCSRGLQCKCSISYIFYSTILSSNGIILVSYLKYLFPYIYIYIWLHSHNLAGINHMNEQQLKQVIIWYCLVQDKYSTFSVHTQYC